MLQNNGEVIQNDDSVGDGTKKSSRPMRRFILIFHKKVEKLFVKVVSEFKSSNSHF